MSKSKTKEKRQKVLGSVASIQTLLERYPTLLTSESDSNGNGNVNVSISFLMALLGMLNLTQQDIVMWMARMLSGKASDGLLNTIEEAGKAILLTNVKSLFTCTADPFIPDEILNSYKDINGAPANGRGLEIDLDAVDMMGILSYCPLSEEGKSFYFDNEIENKTIQNVSDLWKSRDFNAFLWYVINRGDEADKNKRQLMWDNRCKYFKHKDYSTESFREFIKNENTKYILCEYQERLENITEATNVLKIFLNSERYRYKPKGSNIEINRTIFEFNYDYIYSLNLFDSKTITAQIINAVLGLSSTITGTVSIEQRLVQEKIRETVKRIIEDDDSDEEPDTEDYFKFSNDEYNTLLEKATKKYNGKYQTGINNEIDIPFDVINEAVEKISLSKNTEEEISNISNAFNEVAKIISENSDRDDAKSEWGVSYSIQSNLIEKFIEEFTVQLAMSMLSPKVAILYAVNSYVLNGNADDLSSWEKFIETFGNLLKSIIKKIKDIIIQQLYVFVMDNLKPLLELYTNKLLLETIRDYKDLLTNLKRLCLPSSNSNANGSTHLIDNVDYADIIPEKTKP